nr:hypothetical protein [Proteomonas sp. NIES-1005]
MFDQLNYVFSQSMFAEQTAREVEDPVSELLSSLYSGRGLKVEMSGEDDVVLENYLRTSFSNRIQVDTSSDTNFAPNLDNANWIGKSKRSPEFPTKEQKALINKFRPVPIYTVVNGNNELIVASPRVNPPRSSTEWLEDKYSEFFQWKRDEGPVQVGLFFMNREDAEMYLQEVCKRDPRGAEISGLSIKTVGLNVFYETNRTSPPKVQVKLIADLKEVTLATANQNKSVGIHPKQKLSQGTFQGVPMYILRTQEVKNNLIQASILKDQALHFFSIDDALKALHTVFPNQKGLSPHLELYNLENYILDLEQTNVDNINKNVFVPTYESYVANKMTQAEEQLEKKKPLQEVIRNDFESKLKSLQRLYKGVLWLLTSDTLPTEEDSW